MPEFIRAFIAIELDDASRRVLSALQSKLKQARAANAVRWVAVDNIHLTLKFLGEVDVMQIPALEQAVADACAGVAPFELRFVGVGAFPNVTRPNNVWVGVRGDIDIAAALANRIEGACVVLGFPREARGFSPHLTLGRVKQDAGTRERAGIAEMIAGAPTRELGRCACRVERVSLMRSELRLGGSVYTRLSSIELE